MQLQARAASRATGLAIAVMFGTAAASADTVATFADPALDGSTPLFTVESNAISGGWSAAGLDLVVPLTGMTFEDAVFEMDPVAVNPDDTIGAGAVRFYEDAGMANLILRIDFDGGLLFEPLGFGASFISADNVTFSGPVITTPLEDEQFSFSFANPTFAPGANSYTASFTSSAIPEPGSLALAIVGAVCLLRRRR